MPRRRPCCPGGRWATSTAAPGRPELVDDISILGRRLAPAQPLVQDPHAPGSQHETIRIRLNPVRHDQRITAGLAEDHDAERMGVAHPVELWGTLARWRGESIAWWHRYTAARSPCQTSGSSGRCRSVRRRPARPRTTPRPRTDGRRRGRPGRAGSGTGVSMSQAIMPRPTAASPHKTHAGALRAVPAGAAAPAAPPPRGPPSG